MRQSSKGRAAFRFSHDRCQVIDFRRAGPALEEVTLLQAGAQLGRLPCTRLLCRGEMGYEAGRAASQSADSCEGGRGGRHLNAGECS